MAEFILMGKYSQESIKQVSAERTKQASEQIEKLGGKIKSIYALLGEKDLIIIAELPDNEKALQASLALFKITGIAFTTHPAFSVEVFDKLATEI
ncbi:MAG: GYD domain-containing protein [Melioribacter sp.]|nr:GYD domain-containing protein [Melioribacter sp.]